MTEIADRIGYSPPTHSRPRSADSTASLQDDGDSNRHQPAWPASSRTDTTSRVVARRCPRRRSCAASRAQGGRRGQHQLAPISAKPSSCAPPHCVQCGHWTAAVGVGIPAPAGHLVPGGRAVGRLGAAVTVSKWNGPRRASRGHGRSRARRTRPRHRSVARADDADGGHGACSSVVSGSVGL
jgi:hypothetical protein